MFESLETRRFLSASALLDGTIVRIAGTPQADHIGVGVEGADLVVRAEGAIILATPLDGVDGIEARLGEGDDAFNSQPQLDKPMHVFGGDGNDRISTGAAADVLDGGAGDDLLIASGGPDQLIGGPGIDTASYTGRTANLRITLDNLPNDGLLPPPDAIAPAPGEGDNVHADIEHVVGGSGDDFISVGPTIPTTAPFAIVFDGGPGNDTLVAQPPPLPIGATPTRIAAPPATAPTVPATPVARQAVRFFAILNGGEGDDRLVGSAFNDQLNGGPGNDSLHGNDGNDVLDGGTGADLMVGGRGDDIFRSNDGEADSLDGGEGSDRALIDQLDVLTSIEQIVP